ncbi:DNA topoisomerase I [Candidatus Pacearchaeota archaeon]|nr:DNA topoisomerase I [Candidatus Pacearchaeota archaeon]
MARKKKVQVLEGQPTETALVEPKSKKKIISSGRSILIICEKPQAAEKIAAALSNNTDDKIKEKNGVSYFQFNRDGKNVLVGCAVGHLFGIKQNEARGTFPNFDVSWKANYAAKGGEYTKKYYDVLKRLAGEADEVVVATDFDVEGEVIGWNVVRFICKRADAKRMKFSSLTKDELEESWNHLLPTINWGDAYAGETRHHLDWFYGINLSRGLMKALSSTGKFRILSIGRVQGPALKIVYDKEIEIKEFKSTPFWQIFLRIKDFNKNKLEVKYPRDITDKKELKRFEFLKGKKAIAKTDIKEDEIAPPIPFDLTTLQTECYRMVGLTPAQTLSTAQALYLDGIISYPRTSSQKYPEAIGYDKILKKLQKYTQLVKYAVNKKPTEGAKSDPAHPAIYPTGESKKELNETEKKVYDLIVKRFIACFALPAIVENKKVTVEVDGMNFSAKGMLIQEKNWMNVYPNTYKEEEIPTINGEVHIEEIRIEEKMTKPPARYTAASLVKELEKRNLGTKSTRANILETLESRGYIRGKSIEVTELGQRITETLKKYSPVIIDDELTRQFEEEMEQLSSLPKDWQAKETALLNKAKSSITEIAKGITANLSKIGEALAEANEAGYKQQAEENTLSPCPVCKKGNLRIMFGRKFKRYFVSCDAYPECKTIFSLPPGGMMKPAKKKNEEGNEVQEFCAECNSPMVISLRRGKRPWKFCFNPKCKTNEEWQKKKEQYKEKLQEEKEEKEEKIEDKSHEETEMS